MITLYDVSQTSIRTKLDNKNKRRHTVIILNNSATKISDIHIHSIHYAVKMQENRCTV